MERHASTSKYLPSKNKEDYEKEFIHGSCVAAEFVHVYLLRLR